MGCTAVARGRRFARLAAALAALVLALAGCGSSPVESTSTDIFYTQDETMALLADTLYKEIEGGMAIVATGEDEIEGRHCWTYALGTGDEEKFTAEEHYAVTDEGDIYYMDILGGGEYVFYPNQ